MNASGEVSPTGEGYMVSNQQFEVYLAGPITGCNRDQKHRWREELKATVAKLRNDITFRDPAEWSDDWSPLQETMTLRSVDVVVANMWKESVGTTIGIMQAVDVGKPIVLIDSNYLNSKILNGIVHPVEPVRTIKAAAELLNRILSGFRDITVVKTTGEPQPFDREKLVASIQTACGAAKVPDMLFAQQISARVLQSLRRENTREPIPTSRIRDLVFDVLGEMHSSPAYSQEVRLHAARVTQAWLKKEEYRRGDAGVDALNAQVAQLKAERDQAHERWRVLAEGRRARAGQSPHSGSETLPLFGSGEPAQCSGLSPFTAQEPTTLPRNQQFKSVREALDAAAAQYPDSLVISAEARRQADSSGSRWSDKTYRMLCALGECAYDAMLATDEARQPLTTDDWFGLHGDGFQYARGECGGTKERKRYAQQRTVTVGSQEFVCWKHLKAGVRSDSMIRVYFCEDPVSGRIIVGPVGDHLGTFGHDG